MAYPDDLFTSWHATMHGADTDAIRLINDEEHDAVWLYLIGDVAIRIALDAPGAELERDRLGLRRLAQLATKIAQAIEQRQRDMQTQAEATYAELADTPAARAEAEAPEPAGSRGPR